MTTPAAPVPRTGAAELLWWGLRRRRRYRVQGPSMVPTLADGDFVLADPGRSPGVGDVVVARHPREPELIVVKRVAELAPEGLVLVGDAREASTDSRQWGPVALEGVLGVVTSRVG